MSRDHRVVLISAGTIVINCVLASACYVSATREQQRTHKEEMKETSGNDDSSMT